MMRTWALQIGLNVALISAIQVAAKSFARWTQQQRGWAFPAWSGGPRAVVWLAAMLLALPLLVATLRKMRAVAQVLAELTITRAAARENVAVTRNVAANSILIPAVLALGAWVLALSAALLPPWPVLVALLAIIAAVAATMWKQFVRMYAAGQIALRDTLSQDHPSSELALAAPARALHPALADAQVEVLTIDSGSPAAGRLIRELQLRTATGASAVGIERNGQSVVNPGPDEELQPGDRVLLLGHPDQLAAARRLLASPAGPT
jgi:CPA2 family monovalent cation:H+ antiporter-2